MTDSYKDFPKNETVHAHARLVFYVSQMAQLLNAVSRPTERESVLLSVDPDSYPQKGWNDDQQAQTV